jgi:hypothetical protein
MLQAHPVISIDHLCLTQNFLAEIAA